MIPKLIGFTIETIERCFPQNNPHPCSSMTEGGGWGEEFRHNRAITNNGRPRRHERIEITQQKIILFLFELKFRRAHIKINKENFFAGWQSAWSATAGMTSLFRILFKKCSNFVQKTPPNLNLHFHIHTKSFVVGDDGWVNFYFFNFWSFYHQFF